MSGEQSRVIGLGGLLVLVVLVKLTGGLDWLKTIFTYTPYTWQLNPLAEIQLPFGLGGSGAGGSSGGGGGGSSSSSSSSSTNTDSGTHQAMDASGNVYTVNSTYGAASSQQQDDMNRYANNVGNVSG